MKNPRPAEVLSEDTVFYYRPDANRYAGLSLQDEDLDDHPLVRRERDNTSHWSAIGAVNAINERLLEHWVPPASEGFDDDPPRMGEFPSLSNYWSVPVFSERAWQALRPLIEQDCEALPIQHSSGKPFYIIHILGETDAIDLERSDVIYNQTTKRPSHFWKHAFKYDNLINKHLFKVSIRLGRGTYVSETFRQAVKKHKLKGLLFEPLPVVGALE